MSGRCGDNRSKPAKSVEEKQHLVCNYVISLREGLFNLAAAAGINSPVRFSKEHVGYRKEDDSIVNIDKLIHQFVS